jgi:type I restriction enzyme S subunit
MKLKYLARHIDERYVDEETELLSVSKIKGVVPRSEVSDNQGRAEDISHYKTCQPNDLVINRMAAYQGALGVAKQFGAISPDYMVLRFQKFMDPRFVGYLFKSAYMANEMSSRVKGIGSIESGSVRTPRLSWSDLGEVEVAVPPFEDQQAIADFLDQKLASIDVLLDKQQSLIDALEERRKALIIEYISGKFTGGTYKPVQNVDWLSQVPNHWELKRLKYAVAASKGGVWGSEPDDSEDTIWCIRIADFDRKELRVSSVEKTFRNISPSERHGRMLSHGMLILEKSGGGDKTPVGAAVLFEGTEQAVSSNFTNIIKLRNGMFPDFWIYVFEALYVSGQTWKSIKQTSGIQNLDFESYLNELVPFPPLQEQVEICARLESHLRKIFSTQKELERIKTTLNERRTSLIAAAVTGKIDLRG